MCIRDRVRLANLCTYIDPLIFTPLFLVVLPMWLGTDGIWAALPLTQIAVFAIGLGVSLLVYKNARRKKEIYS